MNLPTFHSRPSCSLLVRLYGKSLCTVVAALGITLSSPAYATSTWAHSDVGIEGLETIVQEDTKGIEGVVTRADLLAPGSVGSAKAHSEASAAVGSLKAISSAMADVGTDVLARANALWADDFTIYAPGLSNGEVGTFSAAVSVQGGLLVEASSGPGGYSYGDTYVIATFSLDPNTGFNGGINRVSNGGRHFLDSNMREFRSGEEAFILNLTDVPFTFGRSIAVSLSLSTVSGTRTFNLSSSRSEADYGHTMTWAGISNVRSASGNSINNFTAVSAESGFNFGNIPPVPEPSTTLMLILGIFVGAIFASQRVKAF